MSDRLTSDLENVWFAGIARRQGYTDDINSIKDPFDDATSTDLEKMDLTGLPLTGVHNMNDKVGKIVSSWGGKKNDKHIVGYVDASTDGGKKIIQNGVGKPGGLKALSIAFSTESKPRPGNPRIFDVYKKPIAVGLVDTPGQENCMILYTMPESQLKRGATSYIANPLGLPLNVTKPDPNIKPVTFTGLPYSNKILPSAPVRMSDQTQQQTTAVPTQQVAQPGTVANTVPVNQTQQQQPNTQPNQQQQTTDVALGLTNEQLQQVIKMGYDPEQLKALPSEKLVALIIQSQFNLSQTKQQNDALRASEDFAKRQASELNKKLQDNLFKAAKAIEKDDNKAAAMVNKLNPFTNPDTANLPLTSLIENGEGLHTILAYSNSFLEENEKYKAEVKRLQEELVYAQNLSATQKGAQNPSEQLYEKLMRQQMELRNPASSYKEKSSMALTQSRFHPFAVNQAEKKSVNTGYEQQRDNVGMETTTTKVTSERRIEMPQEGTAAHDFAMKNPDHYAHLNGNLGLSSGLISRLQQGLNSAPVQRTK